MTEFRPPNPDQRVMLNAYALSALPAVIAQLGLLGEQAKMIDAVAKTTWAIARRMLDGQNACDMNRKG